MGLISRVSSRTYRASEFLSSKMLHLVSSLLCFIPSLTIIYLAPPYSVLFTYHPQCMALSFILFFTTLAHQFRKDPKPAWSVFSKKRQVHAYGMIIASISALIGFLAIYINKNLKPDSKEKSYLEVHFTSWHGKFGLVAMISVLCQVLLGLPTFFQKLRLLICLFRRDFLNRILLSFGDCVPDWLVCETVEN